MTSQYSHRKKIRFSNELSIRLLIHQKKQRERMKGKSWNDSFASETMPTYDASADRNNLFVRRNQSKKKKKKKSLSPKRKRNPHSPSSRKKQSSNMFSTGKDTPSHSIFKTSTRTIKPSTMRSVPERMKELEEKKNLSKTLPPISSRRRQEQNLSITYHLASGGDVVSHLTLK